jgi:hypothetical protein
VVALYNNNINGVVVKLTARILLAVVLFWAWTGQAAGCPNIAFERFLNADRVVVRGSSFHEIADRKLIKAAVSFAIALIRQ